MDVKQLIEELKKFNPDDCVICKDSNGGWDNVINVEEDGSCVAIEFGGGSPCSN